MATKWSPLTDPASASLQKENQFKFHFHFRFKLGVGGSNNLSSVLNDVLSLPNHRDDGSGRKILDQRREKRFLGQVLFFFFLFV